jgi:hypothetical protein
VVVAEITAGSLDNTSSRRCGVIGLALAEGDTLGHFCGEGGNEIVWRKRNINGE